MWKTFTLVDEPLPSSLAKWPETTSFKRTTVQLYSSHQQSGTVSKRTRVNRTSRLGFSSTTLNKAGLNVPWANNRLVWFPSNCPGIIHHRGEGSGINDAERLWNWWLLWGQRLINCLFGKEFYSADRCVSTALLTLVKVCPSVFEWLSTHPTTLAAVHVCQSHMLVCVAACTLGTPSLSTCNQLRPDPSLVLYLSRQLLLQN